MLYTTNKGKTPVKRICETELSQLYIKRELINRWLEEWNRERVICHTTPETTTYSNSAQPPLSFGTAIFVWKTGNASMALLVLILKNSAFQWKMSKVVDGYGLHLLQTCIQLPRAQTSTGQQVSRSVCPLFGTVCHLVCVTCLSLNTFKRKFKKVGQAAVSMTSAIRRHCGVYYYWI